MPRQRDQELIAKIGRRIAEVRKTRGWTQEALAEAVQIEAVSLSRVENGSRALSLSTLACIANALGVSLSDLVHVERKLPTSEIAPEEAALLRAFKTLPKRKRDIVLRLAKELVSQT